MEETRSTLTTHEVVSDMLEKVKERWTTASAKFQPPVTVMDKAIHARLTRLWEKSKSIARMQIKSREKVSAFEEQLDRLFDITKCRCAILTCREADCDGCPSSSSSSLPPCHIKCSCPREHKIPVLELPFIRIQREKIGGKSDCMMSSVDIKEHQKMVAALKRKEKSEESRKSKFVQQEQDSQAENPAGDCVDSLDSTSSDLRSDTTDSESAAALKQLAQVKPSSNRNMTKIPNIAMASCRFGVSSTATAAIATATLLDFQVISADDTQMTVDTNKVHRAKATLQEDLRKEAAARAANAGISCIFFDGRRDWTLAYSDKDGSDQRHPCFRKEEHYTVVSEPGGNYLFHFTPNEATKGSTAAEQIAKSFVTWMREHGVDKTLKCIGGDSTNTNTGIWGGVFHQVEMMLGRPLNWLVCGLHINELPLRHLIVGLDGRTCSDTGFTGKHVYINMSLTYK